MLNKLCSASIIEGLPIKKGDPRKLNLPCEFGNSTSINAWADSGASINHMPYSFYKKIALTRLQNMRMTIRTTNHSITHPCRIVEDLLVKVGKFIYPLNFAVLDMKEEEDHTIILDRPFLSTASSLVDIHDTKLKLWVDDKETTFEIDKEVSHDEPIDDMLGVN